MDVIGRDEPLDADLRCFHGTDDMPICIGCAIELAERHGQEAIRLRKQLAGAVWALNEALGALVRHDDREGAIALIEHGLRKAGVDPSRPLGGQ